MKSLGDYQEKCGLDTFVQPLEDKQQHPWSGSIPYPPLCPYLSILSLLLPTRKYKQLLLL